MTGKLSDTQRRKIVTNKNGETEKSNEKSSENFIVNEQSEQNAQGEHNAQTTQLAQPAQDAQSAQSGQLQKRHRSKKPHIMALIFAVILVVGMIGGAYLYKHNSSMQEDNDYGNNSITKYVQDSNGLDYSDSNNWFILPEKKTADVDIFLIYPTEVLDDAKPEYLDQNDEEMKELYQNFYNDSIKPTLDGLDINLYVPKYRQLNGKVFPGKNTDEILSLVEAIPKRDIFNAYDYYLKNFNNNHKFILLSHSQGTMLSGFLVTEFTNDYLTPDVYNLMQCAYMVGAPLDDIVLTDTPYKLSKTPTDINSLVSWSVATKSEVKNKYRFTWGDETSKVVNPITFYANGDYIPASENPLSMLQYFNDPSVTAKANLTGARVIRPYDEGGVFKGEIVELDINEKDFLTQEQIDYLDTLNLGYAHPYAIALFADSLKNNIVLRTDAKFK